MSRHRHIQKLKYNEEYDDVFNGQAIGRSVDDSDYGVSPSTENYLYRHAKQNFAICDYFGEDNITEESDEFYKDQYLDRRNSDSFERPRLCSEDEAKLNSVVDQVHDVVGDSFSDAEIIRAILSNDYAFEPALDSLLNKQDKKRSENMPKRKQASGEPNQRDQKCDSETPVKELQKLEFSSDTTIESQRSIQDKTNNLESSLLSEEKDIVSTPRSITRIRAKEVNVKKKYEELRKSKKKPQINLVVVGHVDAGKSTLMGHLLYLQGNVSQRNMHQYEKESKKLNKQSFMYAWVLDDTDEERERGVTVTVAQRSFETTTRSITLLDAPGHKDFIPNMITGATRADVAVLAVDATIGGFEAGFESGGQTREHTILLRSLGVSQLTIAINKMDMVEWSKERFDEIMSSLRNFFKTIGFRESEVIYVPCSGLLGENLIKRPDSNLISWYNGPTLIEAIDKLNIPERAISRPFRLCISNAEKSFGSNLTVIGRVETGYIQNGDKLLLLPQNNIVSVKDVTPENGEDSCGFAGDHVTLTISGNDDIHTGDFLCDPTSPIPQVSKLQARIVIFNTSMPILTGSQLDFHYQCVTEGVKIVSLMSILHKSTGQVLKQKPRALTKNSSAEVQLAFTKAISIEEFKNFKELGRFMLRKNGATIAAGMVTKIIE